MLRTTSFSVVVLVLIACAATAVNAAGEAYPFPQHVNYAADHILPSNFQQSELDDHVKAFYDYWKPTYVKSAGTDGSGNQMYRVYKDSAGNTVSEGQGYGMVIVAYMAGYDTDAQATFDGLWYFVKSHVSNLNPNNMEWNIDPSGNSQGGDNSAFDGDADITYALLLAAQQWPNVVNVDYLAEAQNRLQGVKDTMGPDSLLPMLGDWVNPTDTGIHNQQSPRISDFMYGHWLAFSSFHTGQQTYWLDVLQTTIDVLGQLQNDFASTTGLLPDFAQYDSGNSRYRPADAGFLEGSNDGNYNYNAGRIPWRIGIYSLITNDASTIAQTQKIADWISAQPSIKAGYTLSGSLIGDYFTTFFAAPFAISAMLDASHQDWLNNVYSQIYNKHETYYEDSVNMLSLLVLSGNWWQPGTTSAGDGSGDGAGDGGGSGDGSSANSLRSVLHQIL